MAQLHEIIAVEAGLKQTAENILQEARKTFTDKQSLFDGFEKTYKARNESDDEKIIGETKHIVTTVPEKLDYIKDSMIRLFDSIGQKEKTNTLAKADIVIDDVVLQKDVPATVLLSLESQMKRIREVYLKTLTLDPAKRWTTSTQEKNVWESDKIPQVRTRKEIVPIIKYEATEHHPAQVDMVGKDVQVGDWETIFKSGAITPIRKSEYLGRIDQLERAIKQARMRANTQEVVDFKIGKTIFDFINEN
jgi:hypothetical protein